jgi:enoyl-CoA hydratase
MEQTNLDVVRYEVRDRKAYLTLNRPKRLNAITMEMARQIKIAVDRANFDSNVHVIILQGEGKAFCSGYDLKQFAEEADCVQPAVWDPIKDYQAMKQNTDDFSSLWRSLKPTIAKIQGYAVAGGSDIALSCDLVVMAEDAKIGYMPARVWGCPTTGMWVYRLGAERAKRMLLTGDTITGKQAMDWGLVIDAVPLDKLDETVETLADRIAGVPINQLVMQKAMINQAYDNMGLNGTQMIATIFDGITRHSPEGRWFQEFSEVHGFAEAVKWRDSGRWIPNGGGPIPTKEEL